MSRPILLIGVGTGGLKTLNLVHKSIENMPTTVEHPMIEYIYMETDNGGKAAPGFTAASLSVENVAASIRTLSETIPSSATWLLKEGLPSSIEAGAGGTPIVGRICANDAANKAKFRAAINQAHQNLLKDNNETPYVYIVGSLAGGTCSGAFIDLAYIVRDGFANNVELCGLFMLPGHDEISTKPDMYCNLIGSLKALEYYNNHPYDYTWEHGQMAQGYKNAPFKLVQFISGEYNTKLPKQGYDSQCESAAMFLYLNALGLYEVREKSLIDACNNTIIDRYTTFGLTAIQYPKNQIENLLSLDCTIELLERWAENTNYYNAQGNRAEINTIKDKFANTAKKEFERYFGNELEKWAISLKTNEHDNVEAEIEALVTTLCDNSLDDRKKKQEIYNQFRSDGGMLYNSLSNNLSKPVDSIIDHVHDTIANTLKTHESLRLAEDVLNGINASFESIMNYWKTTLKISSDGEQWDRKLHAEIDALLPYNYWLLPEKANVYRDRLKYNILSRLIMHLFAKKIQELYKGIKEGGRIYSSTNHHHLVTLKELRDLRTEIMNTLATSSSLEAGKQSVKVKRDEIYNRLRSNESLIYHLVFKESLEKDLENGAIQYKQFRKNKKVSIADLTNETLFDYLQQTSLKNLNNFLFEEVQKRYIKNIKESQAIADFNITTEIVKNFQNTKLYSDRAIIPPLTIKTGGEGLQFMDHADLPYILITDSNNNIKTISNEFKQNAITEFDATTNMDRKSFAHPGLQNCCLFYHEFGVMDNVVPFNPARDLRYYSNYQALYAQRAANYKKTDNLEPATLFNKVRTPYLNITSLQIEVTRLKKEGDELMLNKEYEGAKDFYTQALNWDFSETYPAGKIDEINKLIHSESNLNKKNRCITIADKYLTEGDYQTAKKYYSIALQAVPGEEYIATKLREILNIETEYNAYMNSATTEKAKGIILQHQNNMIEARKHFNHALSELENAKKLMPKIKFVDENISTVKLYLNNN